VTERRRTRRTLVLLLALIGLTATGATHASLGPSEPDPSVFVGNGVGEAMPRGAAGTSSLQPATPTSYVGVNGHGSGHRGVSGHDWWRGPISVAVGTVSGLYPGLTKRLPVTVTNPNSFGIGVTRIKVRTLGTVTCSGHSFTARHSSLVRQRFIRATRTRTFAIPYRMRRTAPDGCQRAHVAIRVRVRAVHR
jgi:hypothetical protein